MFNVFKIGVLVLLTTLAANTEAYERVFYWTSYYSHKGVNKTLVDYSNLKIKSYSEDVPGTLFTIGVEYTEGPIYLYEDITHDEKFQIQHYIKDLEHPKDASTKTFQGCEFYMDFFNDFYQPMFLHHSNISTAKICPIPAGTRVIEPVDSFSQLQAPSNFTFGTYQVDIKFLCDGELCGGFGGEFIVE